MNATDSLHDRAAELVESARALHSAAAGSPSLAAAPDLLASLEEALQLLSAAWYQVAADAATPISQAGSRPRVEGFSREQEVHLMGTLHDVAAAFARCARVCREGRSTVTPVITHRVAAARGDQQRDGSDLSWFESRVRPTQHVA